MLCPLDKSVLRSQAVVETEVSACDICHGLWFGREQLAVFLQTGFKTKVLPKRKIFSGKVQRSASHCFCPSCEKVELSPKIIDGVEIDLCMRCHGIWLDAGELDLIITRYRRKQKLSGFNESTTDILGQAGSDPAILVELGDLISGLLGKSSEWAAEAGPALLDFIGEAFSAIDF